MDDQLLNGRYAFRERVKMQKLSCTVIYSMHQRHPCMSCATLLFYVICRGVMLTSCGTAKVRRESVNNYRMIPHNRRVVLSANVIGGH